MFKKKVNTFFSRLIISFVFVVIIASIFVTAVATGLFSNIFSEEIHSMQIKTLENTEKLIQKSIIEETKKIFISTITSNNLEVVNLFYNQEKDDSKHQNIYFSAIKELKEIENKTPELLYSIEIYYYDLDIVLSSKYSYLSRKNINEKNLNSEFEWIEFIEEKENTFFILPTKTIKDSYYDSGEVNIFQIVYIFPIVANTKIMGAIAFNIYENELNKYVDIFKNHNITYILTDNGEVITTNSELISYPQKISSEENNMAKIINGFDDNKSGYVSYEKNIISYLKFDNINWKFVNIVPSSKFYERKKFVIRILIITAAFTMIAGSIISIILSKSLYMPINSAIKKAKQGLRSSGLKVEEVGQSEYTILNFAVESMTNELDSLKSTLRQNIPLIRNNMAIRLVNNSIKTRQEVNKFFRIMDVLFSYKFNTIVIITFDKFFIEVDDIESVHLVRYKFIDHLIKHKSDICEMLPFEYIDNDIGIIVNSKKCSYEIVVDEIKEIISKFEIDLLCVSKLCIGKFSQNILSMKSSFESAKCALKYIYYYPEKIFLVGEEYEERDNRNESYDSLLIKRFRENLYSNNIEYLEKEIDSICEIMRENHLSVNNCEEILKEIVSMISKYLDDMQNNVPELKNNKFFDKNKIQEKFLSISNINDFKLWVYEIMSKAYYCIRNNYVNKNLEVIISAQNYIKENLGEVLSLEIVAKKVYLSPKYLSRLFKEETSMNFTDYINLCRLEKAKELIIKGKYNIKEISAKVGFNSSAYFIRKFKQQYGTTPKMYKYSSIDC